MSKRRSVAPGGARTREDTRPAIGEARRDGTADWEEVIDLILDELETCHRVVCRRHRVRRHRRGRGEDGHERVEVRKIGEVARRAPAEKLSAMREHREIGDGRAWKNSKNRWGLHRHARRHWHRRHRRLSRLPADPGRPVHARASASASWSRRGSILPDGRLHDRYSRLSSSLTGRHPWHGPKRDPACGEGRSRGRGRWCTEVGARTQGGVKRSEKLTSIVEGNEGLMQWRGRDKATRSPHEQRLGIDENTAIGVEIGARVREDLTETHRHGRRAARKVDRDDLAGDAEHVGGHRHWEAQCSRLSQRDRLHDERYRAILPEQLINVCANVISRLQKVGRLQRRGAVESRPIGHGLAAKRSSSGDDHSQRAAARLHILQVCMDRSVRLCSHTCKTSLRRLGKTTVLSM